MLYKWIYWQVKYLAIRLQNSVSIILIGEMGDFFYPQSVCTC